MRRPIENYTFGCAAGARRDFDRARATVWMIGQTYITIFPPPALKNSASRSNLLNHGISSSERVKRGTDEMVMASWRQGSLQIWPVRLLLAWLVLFYLIAADDAPAAAPRSLAARPPTIVRDIAYPGVAAGVRHQSLDLYLPADSGTRPPLLIFVHGGFWHLSDDDYQLGAKVAEALVGDGVAVALVRYRLAGEARHPAQATDVAAGVSLLIRDAQRYGYDAKRIFLSGHSAGGHLASLVALDRNYLGKFGVKSNALAGVISFSGLYDLQPRWRISQDQKTATENCFGKDPALLKQVSPVTYVRGDAPAFLILVAANDFPGFLQDARQFAAAMVKAGQVQAAHRVIERYDHFSMLNLADRANPARALLDEFIGIQRSSP